MTTQQEDGSTQEDAPKRRANGKYKDYKGKYDPADFSLPASDTKGHNEKIWCRVPPQIDHEVEMIVASRKWPFPTKGHFARWAIWEAVKRIHAMEPVPNSLMPVAETIVKTCQAHESYVQFQKSVEAAEMTVKQLQSVGNEEEIAKLMSALRTIVNQMEEPNWREAYLSEFKKRFGHLEERYRGKAMPLNKLARTGERKERGQ